jgi:hypothetical protein
VFDSFKLDGKSRFRHRRRPRLGPEHATALAEAARMSPSPVDHSTRQNRLP